MKSPFVKCCRLRFAERITATASLIFGTLILLYLSQTDWEKNAKSMINNPAFFPKIVCYGFIIIGVLLIIKSFYTNKEKNISLNLMAFVLLGVWAIYVVLFELIGFVLASMLATLGSMLVWKVEKKLPLVLITILAPTILYIGLGVLMGVRFPTIFL
jgi:hypothetical protein